MFSSIICNDVIAKFSKETPGDWKEDCAYTELHIIAMLKQIILYIIFPNEILHK